MIYSEVPVLEVGLENKVNGSRWNLFEFVQKTKVPDPNERLSNVEKNIPAIVSPLKGRVNGIGDAETLLKSGVKGSETKLVEGNDPLHLKDREKAHEEEPFKHFVKTSIRVENILFGAIVYHLKYNISRTINNSSHEKLVV